MRAQLFPIEDPETAVSEPETAVSEGQLPLFLLPEIPKPVLVQSGMAASNIGEAGESMFEGSCRAWNLPLHKAGRGQIGPDFMVNGHRVQVKATASIQDGYLSFVAGSGKRFIDYAGHVDVFAFIYVGLGDHYGRSRLIEADAVFRHWRGRCVKMRPIELTTSPVLDLLVTPRE